MKSILKAREIIRQPGILIWQGTPSDHSGAYHVILSLGVDGRPVEVSIENPDSPRLEIPGLLDSGWDPDIDQVVEEFFRSAQTCRPLKGVYVNEERINSVEDLAAQFRSVSPALETYFLEPQARPKSGDLCEYCSLVIYRQIENSVETDYFRDLDDLEEDEMTKLGTRLLQVRQFLESGSEGFIQVIVAKEWLSVDGLADNFSWWLWDASDKFVRRISDG